MKSSENSPIIVRPGHVPPEWLVVVSAGPGGPQALAQMLPALPADLPATVIIVQQMRPGFTRVLANHLNQLSKLPVCEPEDGQLLQSSRAVMAPVGFGLTVHRFEQGDAACNILIEDLKGVPEKLEHRVDDTMTSAARAYSRNAIGVLLTGTGQDGAQGLASIMEAGGLTIAQDEATSVVHDSPAAAIRAQAVAEVLPLWRMAERLSQIVRGEVDATAA